MPAKREVRCEACGTINRVPGYSIRKIPQCGKCEAPLPEHTAVRAARSLYRWRYFLILVAVIASPIALFAWTWPPPSTRPITSAVRPPACSPVEPTTIGGILRVYDTQDQPRLTQWTINAGLGADYFVKLVELRTGLPKVAYFVHGGQSLTTDIPIGAFTIKHASGKNWCGEAQYFGPNTVFQRGTNTVFVDEDHTYTLYLTPQRNGNFPTKFITRDQF